MSEEQFIGDIIWFDPKRGFGFIEWNKDGVKQKDIFAHFSDIYCEGFKTLYKGQKVSFELGLNIRGEPKAVKITVLRN